VKALAAAATGLFSLDALAQQQEQREDAEQTTTTSSSAEDPSKAKSQEGDVVFDFFP
jgi:hypothetical protein